MKTLALFLLTFVAPLFLLPGFVGYVLAFGIGLPLTVGYYLRDSFPRRSDPDVISSDPNEAEQDYADKLNRWYVMMRRPDRR
jgi:hypothetical protein